MALCCVASCTSGSNEPNPPHPLVDADRVAEAEQAAGALCPILWEWIKEVGGIMNELSEVGVAEPDHEARLAFYADQLDRIAEVNTELGDDVATLAGPILDPLVEDVRAGLLRGSAVLDAMRRSLGERPDLEERRPQLRISGLFISAEKVIDHAKPELARYGDEALIAGFQRVPSCQHSVKDVDDGQPRYNG